MLVCLGCAEPGVGRLPSLSKRSVGLLELTFSLNYQYTTLLPDLVFSVGKYKLGTINTKQRQNSDRLYRMLRFAILSDKMDVGHVVFRIEIVSTSS